MNKIKDWIERLKKGHMLTVITIMLICIIILFSILYMTFKNEKIETENNYNMAFYELVTYIQNIEVYLAKALITSTSEHSAETLTHIWREADLARSYLTRLPIASYELENTEKFLNQVSDYSYSLSSKNIYGEDITEEEFQNLSKLHQYSIELENTLNQLSQDLNNGRFKWGDLEKKATPIFAQEVDSIGKDSFSNIEQNLNEYAGLIYDGAYSNHIVNEEKAGLTGENLTEEQCLEKVKTFLELDSIEEIEKLGFSENGNIEVYIFSIKSEEDKSVNISISKQGGHIVYMNMNRDINVENISEEEAYNYGKNYLETKGYGEMEPTYYIKQEGIMTINYAAVQDNIILYPDLIKVKIALDNGEVLGIETAGYLNNHKEREIKNTMISIEEAKIILNERLNIESENLAIIPTKWKTEVLCYEFEGKIENREFLVYINAITGKEEEILVITDTPNGKLVM